MWWERFLQEMFRGVEHLWRAAILASLRTNAGMMGVNVVQLTSKSHHENILSSLHQLRLQGLLSDVTVQVDFQGSVQEFQAHQVVLAASSGYFKKIFLSEDAAQDQLLLSNMHADDFSKYLEFVYTGKVEVANDKITDIQAVAQLLDCTCLSELCGEAVNAGIAQIPKKKKSVSSANQCDSLSVRKGKRKKQNENLATKQHLSPPRSKEKVIAKRLRADTAEKNEGETEKLVKQKKCGNNVVELQMKNEAINNEKQTTGEGTVMKDRTEGETRPQSQVENSGETSVEMLDPRVEDWDFEDESPNIDPEAPALPTDEEQVEEDGESKMNFTRTSKGKFQCNKCQRTFHYERSYLKHIGTYHGVKADVVYRCETCLQTFANRSNLKIHEKHVHSNERLFICSSCSKTFKRKKDVVRHQRQVHERNNMRHVCPECGKALSSKTALLLHERTHTGAKPFQCPSCEARFSQKAALKMHYRTHTGEKPFACDECDARFTQKHMLAYHKRSHTGEKPFMCEACGKSFASKEYLRHHSNIHTGFKPHKCEHCGRGFAQRNSLHQHLKTHTGERPYSCKDCDKTFTQINALQRHWRIHTGEKPYMCGLCNRTFTDMSTLRRHIMIHDCDAPWKTYLVVVEGNVEDKKSQTATKGKTEKVGAREKKSSTTNVAAAAAAEVTGEAGVYGQADAEGSADATDGKVMAGEDGPAVAESANKTSTDSIVVSAAEPVSLPSDWPSHGTIALVSHTALGGITVIHTEMPPGAQIQPIVATDSTGANIFSLDGSGIPVPFSIPVSMAHPVSLSSTSNSVSSVLSVPVSGGTLASVSGIPTVSSSVLEAAVSQTILAPDSDTRVTAEMDLLGEGFKTVIVSEQERGHEKNAAVQSDKEQRTEDSVDQLKKTSDQEAV